MKSCTIKNIYANPYKCPLCKEHFPTKSILITHLDRRKKCTQMTEYNQKILEAYAQNNQIILGNRFKCHKCNKDYTRNTSLTLHLKKCKAGSYIPDEMMNMLEKISSDFSNLKESQEKLTENQEQLAKKIPEQINQIVKEQTQYVKPNNLMVHIGNNEDLFQRLETLMGNEVEVLNYIVDCALGDKHGSGSGKLVKKAYDLGLDFQPNGVLPAFGWDDTKLTRVRFRNQKGEWEIESKQQFADRITEYLKTCYNKTFQKLVKYKSDNGEYPCEWDTYRLTSWNEMSALRNQPRFKKDLMNSLSLSKITNEMTSRTRTLVTEPNSNPIPQLRPKSSLQPRRIIQEDEDSETELLISDIEPNTNDESDIEIRDPISQFINSKILFPTTPNIVNSSGSGSIDPIKPITDIQQLTKASPPSTFIPGAPPELIPIKYVSPNTISVKDLIHNKGNNKTIGGNSLSKPIY